jgi:hypothetical protein
MMIKKFLATGGLTAVLIGGIAGVAVAAASHPASAAGPASAARPAAAVQHLRATGPYQAKESDPSDPSGEATSPGTEATSPGTDAPGGHQDPPGQNIDHQFEGVE